MSAGALAGTTPTSRPFVLRAGGVDITRMVPLGDAPIHVSESTDGAGQMTFTIEDPASRDFRLGSEVTFYDKRNGTWPLFGGHLVNIRARRRAGVPGRFLECTAIGYDVWLDWRIIKSWVSRNSRTGSPIDNDREMVKRIADFAGPRVSTTGGFVALTNSNMDLVKVSGVTVREALDRVAQTATIWSDAPNRSFYVDVTGELHYYRDVELLEAPYRIADGHYTRTVRDTSGLVSLWPLREASGAPAGDGMGYAPGTMTGGYTRGVAALVANEPQMTGTLLDGSTGYMVASGANLHPGDTFSIEFWCRRRVTGTAQTVWSGGTDDVEIGFTAGDSLVVIKEGTGNNFVTDASFASTSTVYHVVVTRSPGNTDVYVNGTSRAGTATARTFVAGSGTVNIGRRKSSTDRYFAGDLSHVAVYSSKLSAATVTAHRYQGVSIAPESMVLEMDASDGREKVYVAGANDPGTGWVVPGDVNGVTLRTAFGTDEPQRQEIIERQDSASVNKREDYGSAFLKRHNDPIVSGSFVVTGYDGWRVGQRVYFTDAALGISDYPIDIKQIETDVLMGNGTIRYDITVGRVPRTGMRVVSRSIRRRR